MKCLRDQNRLSATDEEGVEGVLQASRKHALERTSPLPLVVVIAAQWFSCTTSEDDSENLLAHYNGLNAGHLFS